ncbi:MAG: hypothetical protein ABIK43_07445 [candidate division WOR-3 bacterium]
MVPYSDYTRHKVYLRFQPGARYARYFDTTLYNLLQESRLQDELTLGLTVTRMWGNAKVSASGLHYLHDFSKNRVDLSGSLSLRVVAGLTPILMGNYSFVPNQRSLRKAGATDEERFLSLPKLAIGYSC